MKYIIQTLIITLLPLFIAAQPLEVSITENLELNSGDNFEVSLTVSDFTDLLTFQLFLTWDANVYRIDELIFANEDLSFFDSGIILPNDDVSIPDPGKVRIVWADAAPVSLPDGTLLVTFGFTVLGQTCDVSEFSFNDIGPQESEQLSVVNAAFEEIGLDFTPNNVMIPGQGCTTSTSDLAAGIDVNVYPNPVVEKINVDLGEYNLSAGKLNIYDVSGRLIKGFDIDNQINTLDVSDIDEGHYIYTIEEKTTILSRGTLTKVQ